MCGILFVESRDPIPLEKHLEALEILKSRGPDFSCYEHRGNKFIAQTVLHITGNADFYNRTSTDFFAYNGEIYDFKWYGSYSNDIQLPIMRLNEITDCSNILKVHGPGFIPTLKPLCTLVIRRVNTIYIDTR
jgi:asparagine synthetase B (glutamine-hydrolysing)